MPEDGGTISDPVLLMEVMEQRELVEETSDVNALQVMLTENKLLEQATTEVIACNFKYCIFFELLIGAVIVPSSPHQASTFCLEPLFQIFFEVSHYVAEISESCFLAETL